MEKLSKNKLRLLLSFTKKKARDEQNLFLAEGNKLVRDLLPYFHCKTIVGTVDFFEKEEIRLESDCYIATKEELERLSLTRSPQAVWALFERKEHNLNLSELKEKLSLALDGVQDPGDLRIHFNILRDQHMKPFHTDFCLLVFLRVRSFHMLRPLKRNFDRKGRADSLLALNRNPASHEIDHIFGERHAKAAAAVAVGSGSVLLGERLKQPGKKGLLHADAAILHGEAKHPALLCEVRLLHGKGDRSRRIGGRLHRRQRIAKALKPEPTHKGAA